MSPFSDIVPTWDLENLHNENILTNFIASVYLVYPLVFGANRELVTVVNVETGSVALSVSTLTWTQSTLLTNLLDCYTQVFPEPVLPCNLFEGLQ